MPTARNTPVSTESLSSTIPPKKRASLRNCSKDAKLRQRGLGVVRQLRRDLERDEPVSAVCLPVHFGQDVCRHLDVADVVAWLAEIRRHVALPVGVGFGIRDAVSAQAIAAHADAIVIGSRIIQEIESGPTAQAPERAAAWLATIRTAMDQIARKAA